MGTIKDLTDTYFLIKEKSRDLLKKHDYEKYVKLIEEEYDLLYKKTIDLQNKIDELEKAKKIILNSNHLKILKLFTENIDYSASEIQYEKILKTNIDLEISFNELRENGYIVYSNKDYHDIYGWHSVYKLNYNKISEVLKAVKNEGKDEKL